jgi:hypothetical protein
LKFTSEIQKFRTRNPAIQGMDFCVKNALKLTYEHLGYQKILQGRSPRTPRKEKGRKGKEKGWVGRRRKGKERRGRERQGKRKGRGGEGEGIGEKGKE